MLIRRGGQIQQGAVARPGGRQKDIEHYSAWTAPPLERRGEQPFSFLEQILLCMNKLTSNYAKQHQEDLPSITKD